MAVEPTGPLGGVTVLEVGAFMAAPFATMQLADLGARVLEVENPTGGDPVRATGPFLDGESSPFVRLNRNKESVALDLKSPEGKEAFLRLAARADVLVENLRPGAMRGLGFGYEAIRQVNPRIVYASASAWGQDGPPASEGGGPPHPPGHPLRRRRHCQPGLRQRGLPRGGRRVRDQAAGRLAGPVTDPSATGRDRVAQRPEPIAATEHEEDGR